MRFENITPLKMWIFFILFLRFVRVGHRSTFSSFYTFCFGIRSLFTIHIHCSMLNVLFAVLCMFHNCSPFDVHIANGKWTIDRTNERIVVRITIEYVMVHDLMKSTTKCTLNGEKWLKSRLTYSSNILIAEISTTM